MRNFPGAWAQLEAIEGHSQQWAAMKSSEEHLRTSGPIEGIPFETVRNYWTCSTRAQAICKPNEKHSKDLEFRKRFETYGTIDNRLQQLEAIEAIWKQTSDGVVWQLEVVSAIGGPGGGFFFRAGGLS